MNSHQKIEGRKHFSPVFAPRLKCCLFSAQSLDPELFVRKLRLFYVPCKKYCLLEFCNWVSFDKMRSFLKNRDRRESSCHIEQKVKKLLFSARSIKHVFYRKFCILWFFFFKRSFWSVSRKLIFVILILYIWRSRLENVWDFQLTFRMPKKISVQIFSLLSFILKFTLSPILIDWLLICIDQYK